MKSHRYPRSRPAPRSAFAGYRFPPEVITLAVRWYLRFGLSYRDVEELLAERGIKVDHVTIYRWVQRFAPEFAEAARARQHLVGDRWHVDETYLKVGGTWRYLFRAIDQFGQVIDAFLSPRRNREAARRFFAQAISRTRVSPTEVTTDRYRVYPRVLDELLLAAFNDTEAHANNPLETDHGHLKALRGALIAIGGLTSGFPLQGSFGGGRQRGCVEPDNIEKTGGLVRGDSLDSPSWPPGPSKSSELQERPGHGPDPRFLCPTGL
jgi:transposase-like protein